ncbi:MAG: zinc ribbon domain-containing protein [Acidobacteria bacterium]|nr:zinc ribbon domain-containing protein [Acidobacteriota bacterium]
MKCTKCAAEAGSGRFCRSCGAPTATASEGAAQAVVVCPSCRTSVPPGAKFCANCAAPLGSAPVQPPAAVPAEPILICVHCGTEAKAGTKFCNACGKSVAAVPPPPTPDAAPTLASPDLMPTAVISTPARSAAPPQVAPPAPQPVPVVPAAAPKLVPKVQPNAPFAGQAPQQPGGSRILVVTSIIILAIAAAGSVYWFVLRKPTAASTQNASPSDTTAVAQPANQAPADSTSQAGVSPDSQPASSSDSQPSADATPASTDAAGTAPTGNSPASGNPSTPAPPAHPLKRPPAKATGSAFAQAHANAEQAFAASQYLNPPEGSALFWARKAKALGDPGAAQVEQDVFNKLMADFTAARQSHSYDQAQAQLYQIASSFPEHTELRHVQDEVHQEQQHYAQQMEEQRRQAEAAAQTKKFAVQHRHGTGESSCTGTISVTPDGVGHYDCSTPDGKGRCEHVVFGADSLKEVKVRGDGSLHVATRQQGNFDFTGADMTVRDASTALVHLVGKH